MEGTETDPPAELRVLAARHVLGISYSWEFPPVADRALVNRVYSPSIAELAAMPEPIMSDAAPLLERALIELGLTLPSRAEAAWTIARHCMERIVSTTERPFEVLRLLNDASQAATDVLPNQKYVGDGLDLGSLIGNYWSYTDPNENYYDREKRLITDEGERQALLDSLTRQEARAWLDRHPL
jgi:hypothetical protein